MGDKDLKALQNYYRELKNFKNGIISEDEFLKNINIINKYDEKIWENSELLKNFIEKYKGSYIDEDNITIDEKVNLEDIVGTELHESYSDIPWLIALPLLKRFKQNFEKSIKDKDKFIELMVTNKFNSERLELIENEGKYYIRSGHNRIIVAKALNLEYLKADVFRKS